MSDVKRLYDEAKSKFHDALQLAESNPEPGSQEWFRWQVAVLSAAAANDRFVLERGEQHLDREDQASAIRRQGWERDLPTRH